MTVTAIPSIPGRPACRNMRPPAEAPFAGRRPAWSLQEQ